MGKLSTPFRLQLPRRLYREIVAHARRELPRECCGLLAGRIDGLIERNAVALAVRCYPLINELASPVEYLSEPKSMFAAVKEMRAADLEIIAVYHSHPTQEPVPSKKDLARNYSSAVVNLIVSLQSTEPVMRGWWLTEDRYLETDWDWLDDIPLDCG